MNTFQTLDDLMHHVFESILKGGNLINPRRGQAKETISVALRLSNPRARLSRTEGKGTVFSCLGEFLWYLTGEACPEFISYYVPAYADKAGDLEGGEVPAAYGPRLFKGSPNQVDRVFETLKTKQDSRRAITLLLRPEDLAKNGELPCTNTLQFFLRDNVLHLQANMRSNDAYSGLPHDVFAFTMLQELMANKLGARLGSYTHIVGSLHIYEQNFEDCQRYLNEGYQSTKKPMPKMPANSFEVLPQILKLEEEIRRGIRENTKGLALDQYWTDICILLLTYQAYRQQNGERLDSLKGEINDESYSSFFEKKIAQHERKQKT